MAYKKKTDFVNPNSSIPIGKLSDGAAVSAFVKNEIMKQLKREGILDELGLQNLDLLGYTPKLQITDDPKIKNFMITR